MGRTFVKGREEGDCQDKKLGGIEANWSEPNPNQWGEKGARKPANPYGEVKSSFSHRTITYKLRVSPSKINAEQVLNQVKDVSWRGGEKGKWLKSGQQKG